MFKPINKNLVVKVVKEEGGLVFVPDNFEVPNEGIVSLEIVASDSESAPKGMFAVYPFHRGIKYKKDNVDYVILRELDLCGVETADAPDGYESIELSPRMGKATKKQLDKLN